MLGLNKPIYEKTAAYGHFGRDSQSQMALFLGKIQIKKIFLISNKLKIIIKSKYIHLTLLKFQNGPRPIFFWKIVKMLNKRADKLELLRIAEAVALEKSIDKELIINSMETGIAKAAKSKFGQDNEIKVLINRDNGDIGIFRKLVIVEKPENINTEISLQNAIILDPMKIKLKKLEMKFYKHYPPLILEELQHKQRNK